MVSQGFLPFQYETERSDSGMTGLAGLPSFLELSALAGMRESLIEHVCARDGGIGWSDAAMVTSLVMLNLAGGTCVDDIEKLAGDAGFCHVLKQVEWARLPRQMRRKLERRWRTESVRAVPSASSIRRYLNGFHNAGEEDKREKGKALIPEKNAALKGLEHVNADVVAFLQKHRPLAVATLDQDATLVGTDKKQALYCYKKFRAYQPFNTWWDEQQVVVHSEFRDGNVPAGFEQLRVFKKALELLPKGVKVVRLRSDTAAYQWDLMRYCEEGRSDRFGRIEFVIGVDITDAFKTAVHTTPNLTWHHFGDDEQQWAEVSFAPNNACYTKRGEYRFIAVREPVRQLEIFDDSDQLPFPTISKTDANGHALSYKLTAVVTNRTTPPATEVIQWYRNRCGKSEEAHSIMKEDLAGGRLPSKRFGANAAWWAIMILALNLVMLMKRLVLGDDWLTRRMKAIRFWLINVPGRLIRRARQQMIRLSSRHPSSELLMEVRAGIRALMPSPSG